MKCYPAAALALSLMLAGTAAAELQPRKAPPAPAPAPKTTPAPVADKPSATPAAPTATEDGTPKLSPELSAKLLKELDNLEKGLGGKRDSESQALIKELKEAAGSDEKAFNLYESCLKEIEYDQKGKHASAFVEWKRTKGKELAVNNDFCASIRLQAQFMALALLDSHSETPESRLSVLADANLYMEALIKLCERNEGLAKSVLASIMDVTLEPDKAVTVGNLEESLKQSREASAALGGDVMECLLAKKLKPESCTGPKGIAARNPGNLDEIYERLILKTLRDKKDTAGLAAAWGRRIAQTSALTKATKVKELGEKFETEKLPVLKWLYAVDQWRCGQTEAAAAAMLAVIRANPGHKLCPGWVEELRGLATGK
ncbi:MAG: hypothetical protein JWM59_4446 [Verrucomicrobiales bacterium]|nr:hypothetical protein [Verrucomicrobiales bacterium]